MVVRKYLAEGSVAKVIWEENVRWKEERAQNSALRKLTLMGKSRWTRMSQASKRDVGPGRRERSESAASCGCSVFFIRIVLFKPHIHSVSALVPSLSQALGVRGVPIKKTKFLLIWCL